MWSVCPNEPGYCFQSIPDSQRADAPSFLKASLRLECSRRVHGQTDKRWNRDLLLMVSFWMAGHQERKCGLRKQFSGNNTIFISPYGLRSLSPRSISTEGRDDTAFSYSNISVSAFSASDNYGHFTDILISLVEWANEHTIFWIALLLLKKCQMCLLKCNLWFCVVSFHWMSHTLHMSYFTIPNMWKATVFSMALFFFIDWF